MLRIASSTRSRSFGRTVAVSLMTCDTVPIETPARSAICCIVTGMVMACRPESRVSCGVRNYRVLPARLLSFRSILLRLLSLRSLSLRSSLLRSLQVHYATESHSPGTVHAGGNQQQLAVFIQFIRLRKIPDRPLRLIVTAPAQNAAPRVLIDKLLRPLPHISYHIHHAEWTRSLRMSIHRIRTSHGARLVRQRH